MRTKSRFQYSKLAMRSNLITFGVANTAKRPLRRGVAA
jgi:hypothetical protein